MELYLSACSKAANVAATKTATSGLASESQQCGDVSSSQPGVVVLRPGFRPCGAGAGIATDRSRDS